jgi:hypothetical protein
LNKTLAMILLFFVFSKTSVAADYFIDFGLVLNFENIRPLIDSCTDLGSMERNRSTLEATGDLETLRDLIESISFGEFSGCPEGVTGQGIFQVAE